MQLQIDKLGKVSITVEKGYWDIDKDYDKLTVVEKEGTFGTFISRKPVPAGTVLTDRTYWIPFSSLKEDIILDYNAFRDKYGTELATIKDRLNLIEEQLIILNKLNENTDKALSDANSAINIANNAITEANNTLEKAKDIIEINENLQTDIQDLQTEDRDIKDTIEGIRINFNSNINNLRDDVNDKIKHIGTFTSLETALSSSLNSKRIPILLFDYNNAKGIIINQINENNIVSQYIYINRNTYHRDVTFDGNGNYNAFPLEETGVHHIDFTRLTTAFNINFKSYQNNILKTISIPLASPALAGLLSPSNIAKLNNTPVFFKKINADKLFKLTTESTHNNIIDALREYEWSLYVNSSDLYQVVNDGYVFQDNTTKARIKVEKTNKGYTFLQITNSIPEEGIRIKTVSIDCTETGVYTCTSSGTSKQIADMESLLSISNDLSVTKSIVTNLQQTINTIIEEDTDNVINKFNEIVNFLANIENTNTLEGILNGINTSINEVKNMAINFHIVTNVSVSPNIIYKGEINNVNINYSAKLSDKILTCSATLDSENGDLVSNPYSVTDTRTFKLFIHINDVNNNINTIVPKSITVNAYYPKYYGCSDKETITETDILSFTKQPADSKATANNITTNIPSNSYLWLCVPNSMTINKVTSSGFEVPMANPISIEVTNKGTYKCYKTANKIQQGSITYNIQ